MQDSRSFQYATLAPKKKRLMAQQSRIPWPPQPSPSQLCKHFFSDRLERNQVLPPSPTLPFAYFYDPYKWMKKITLYRPDKVAETPTVYGIS